MSEDEQNIDPWLTIVGIGDDGLAGLSPSAQTLIEGAEVLFGGERQLNLVNGAAGQAERVTWAGLQETIAMIKDRRGQPTVVLASGDPMHFGFGATLVRHFGHIEMTVIPAVGAFSLAAARMGWPLQDVRCLSVHGRPVEDIALHLHGGARILALCENGETPEQVAKMLVERNYERSNLTVLEHLGGPTEARLDATAEDWPQRRTADLNTLAVECIASHGAASNSRVPGLPDDAFLHDGQITKREVRAVTLAALAPMPGQALWDVGSGSGSIAIEWMRAAPGASAVAFERKAERIDRIVRNAANLGVPLLKTMHGEAVTNLKISGMKAQPDAVFIGGGIGGRGNLLEAGWNVLRRGGRLVANAVTAESEARLLAFHAKHGGELVRLQVSRLTPIGKQHGWSSLAPITQYIGEKP